MEGHQDHGGEGAGRMQAVLTAAAVEQQHPARKCPRCNSENTKFCYYNNYSQSQPRYFCKGCRRYWTHGGSLRKVPAGGSSRRYKRPRPNAPPSTFPQPAPAQLIVPSTSQMLPPYSPAPHYFPGPFHGGGGAGFYSSLVALQSMNQAPLGTLASNLGNFFHGFDYATGLIDQKPCATSSGILPPFAGVGGAWNASGGAGGGGPQLAGDNSKPDFPSGGGACAGGSHDN